MLFNSLTFVVFFVVVLILHNLKFPWRLKKFNLLIASYIFYAAWNPPLVFLLWISTIVDWFASRMVAGASTKGRRIGGLMVSLYVNLGLLGFFKYGGFVLENFTAMMHAVGFNYNPAAPSIVLPMGISFYTFQTLSYTIDVYRKELKPWHSFLDYALYVTFFPQLVAGPIVRASEFLPQCKKPTKVTANAFIWGLVLLTVGLFQKVVLADGFLAKPADDVFGAANAVTTFDAWVGVLAFSAQIFSDFAGYSTCAVGAALCLGFNLPNNFRFPYAATGFSDFWRRWHITLSTWLRDYLYIPLGGSRVSTPRIYANLMITMLLGGLWHGAAWTFVVWGGLHGLYLSAERWLRMRLGHKAWVKTMAAEVCFILLTYFLVLITWVFFRADDFATAWRLIAAMFGALDGGAVVLPYFDIAAVLIINAGLLLAHWMMRHSSHEWLVERTPWWLASLIWFGMIISIILMQGGGDAFIYFQF
ncbi:MBOAT family protein [bacterium]|nr:MBOAT family protein [bacterium]